MTKFFERTYLTKSLQELVCEVLGRLSGDNIHTSAVYNLTTQFGGGKTHSLTLLYHLAKNGANARGWQGMPMVLAQSGLQEIPNTRVAVFIGRSFDVMNGKGGANELHRNTPWGDLAYQLGGEKAFEIVAKHDKELTAPSTDVIRKIIPKDKPVLILMDEVMDYVGRALNVKAGETKETTLASQFYSFICNLSEVATSQEKICLVVSLPRSEMEMSPEEEVIFARINKFLNRTSKSYILSEGMEIPEIVRRRLFEWTELPADGKKAAEEYASRLSDYNILHDDAVKAGYKGEDDLDVK